LTNSKIHRRLTVGKISVTGERNKSAATSHLSVTGSGRTPTWRRTPGPNVI